LSESKSILIVDDDVDILHAAKLFLKRHFQKIEIEQNPQKIPFLLNNFKFDLVLLDMNFSRDINTGNEGFHWLDVILDINPEQKIILFTAFGDVEMAVRAIKNGAADFILKPWINDKLLETIIASLEAEQKIHSKPFLDIIGESAEMKKVLDLAKQVASTDANILLLGENGTGKDLLAKEIHRLSDRAKKPFVHADLGSISENLFESELFGHAKGAFTDAKEDRKGRFAEADGGTLFLDEIGNVPLHLQTKLLYALQNQSFIKVGTNKSSSFDARLICATNENINQKVADKLFRQDLFFRINTIEITLPPLRERGEDILLLAEHFFAIYNAKYSRKLKGMSSKYQKSLLAYAWPGNIRELQHAIERAVIISKGSTINEEVFENKSISSVSAESFVLEEIEKDRIIKTLKRYNGNITDAAKEMGISRQALYRRIEKFSL
jgi:two-component system, NtrC family, response regulator HydG